MRNCQKYSFLWILVGNLHFCRATTVYRSGLMTSVLATIFLYFLLATFYMLNIWPKYHWFRSYRWKTVKTVEKVVTFPTFLHFATWRRNFFSLTLFINFVGLFKRAKQISMRFTRYELQKKFRFLQKYAKIQLLVQKCGRW